MDKKKDDGEVGDRCPISKSDERLAFRVKMDEPTCPISSLRICIVQHTGYCSSTAKSYTASTSLMLPRRAH
jgi:hypothetical protein